MFLVILFISTFQKEIYVAPNGDNSNDGTKDSPFATLGFAYQNADAFDTIYIKGGVYRVTSSELMGVNYVYTIVFYLTKDNINIFGCPGERPIFDLSQVKLTESRLSVFYVTGSYHHLKNFEIVGTPQAKISNAQSECISNRKGNNNIYENLAMHDGMGIGFYLSQGSNNLVLNCDAYNNFDSISDNGRGGNVDGFGGHSAVGSVNNTFRGCRAWYNSDDGFDLINCREVFVIDHCWAFFNGYKPGALITAGDGTGIKAGGYGMSANPSVPDVVPSHVITRSICYYNKNRGFYSNHHIGGLVWKYNSGYKNPCNFCMVNRKSVLEAVDVDGYDHIIENNLSFEPRTKNLDIYQVNESACTIQNNSFLPKSYSVTADDFESIDWKLLMTPRKEDGSLPDIGFLKLKETSELYSAEIGYSVPEN
ncbi:pectate lyase [Tritrichomonas foetus]|uniref:Pectate lyase n=1 Tax=Tritrichomonas foetus TaxID=1144522 RepID=A0A1J4JCG3_9EUKA|nr:pectate lyase [Tritrichomonas foetus]|eukprot:OHS96353.1 pectate lyase [Tritrichomonas foetus]